MYYHSLQTLAQRLGHNENYWSYSQRFEPVKQHFVTKYNDFTAKAKNVSEQMLQRNADLRGKLGRIQEWEDEMRALCDDFDFNLEQIAEIEAFNQAKIDKIGKEMEGQTESSKKFKAIIEA